MPTHSQSEPRANASLLRRASRLLRNLLWIARPGGLHQQLDRLETRLHGLDTRLHDLQLVAGDIRREQQSLGWVYGHHMRLDPTDTVISPRLREQGCIEEFETDLIQRAVRPGDTVLDIGANIGYYTLQFGRLVGAEGHVFAFEPDPHNFALLKRNVRQNAYRNITLVQKAVWSSSGTMTLFRNPENHGDHRTYKSDAQRDSVDVEAVALDDFFHGYNGSIDFIKFDIQGAERTAIRGMRNLLARHHNLRIVAEFWPRGLHLCGDDPEEFLTHLLDIGFDVLVIDETSEQLAPLNIGPLLDRLPVEPETDILFTNLFCERTDNPTSKLDVAGVVTA